MSENGEVSRRSARRIALDAAMGALWGAAVAVISLIGGPIRAIVDTLFGDPVPPSGPSDLRVQATFFGAVVIAGAALGIAKPLLRRARGFYVGFALAGTFVEAVSVAINPRGIARTPLDDWILLPLFGAVFGAGVGFCLRRASELFTWFPRV